MNKEKNSRYSTIEASEYLGLKPSTLASWRCTGASNLKYRKIGRLVYYFQSDLDEFLEDAVRTHTGQEV